MKKLTKIRLINWHYFSNETIEVKGNILLTGQNASGKSTILDAITYIITAGGKQFNLAANEKGKRDLKGYVKCKLGRDDKEYLRDGDVSGHVCLEFYDESQDEYFVVGAVIDAFEITPAKELFYSISGRMEDRMFINGKEIYNTQDFRKANRNAEIFATTKEAKRGFRTLFGNLNEDFFKLIPKALAFKPMADVKEFIYQHLLEEKNIDVQSIQDSIRAYKELEDTLKLTKKKINDLHEIEYDYQEILSARKQKSYYEYIIKRFDGKKKEFERESFQKSLAQAEISLETTKKNIQEIDRDLDILNERKNELYFLLQNDESFKNEEYLNKQIEKQNLAIRELTDSHASYLTKASYAKEIANELRIINDLDCYKELASLNLAKANSANVESLKSKLAELEISYKDQVADLNIKIGQVGAQKKAALEEISNIAFRLQHLQNNRLSYPHYVTVIRDEISKGLREIYGVDITVHILAEVLEIIDNSWQDTIEIFLGSRRFNFIVEPRYYDQALAIFERATDKYDYSLSSLVNTKKIGNYNSCKEHSLASIINSENVDALRYINFLCGNVIMVEDKYDLDKYDHSITNSGLYYSSYSVSRLNRRVERPFIGSNAVEGQKALWNQKALDARNEFNKINASEKSLQQELNSVNKIDIQGLLKEIDVVVRLESAKIELDNLKEKKANSGIFSTNEIKDEYDSTMHTIANCTAKRDQAMKSLGEINNIIQQFNASIANINHVISQNNEYLDSLKKDNLDLEQQANQEIEDVLKETKNFEKINQNYEAKVNQENQNVKVLETGLSNKQAKYCSSYSSSNSIGVQYIDQYLKELNKLEKSELVKYERDVRNAREKAEVVFREDFLSKLRNYIMSAEDEIAKINQTLKTIKFGNDSYEFVFPRSKEYAAFYDMVTSDLNEEDNPTGIFAIDFEAKYNQQLEELFEALAQDELNSRGAISKFTDYRTYMDYDIKITGSDNSVMYYSKVSREKSGGETQVPFYVAIIASFVRVYQKANKSGLTDSIGLVMFDEVFDKMDGQRMTSMMNFILGMPLQIILACPPQRMSVLAPYTDTTLITIRPKDHATVFYAQQDENGTYKMRGK